MRARLPLLLGSALLVIAGCAAEDDSSVTDSSDLNEGRGAIERELDPPLSPPESPLIGAAIEDVIAEVAANATELEAERTNGDCERVQLESKSSNDIVAEIVRCASSETLRIFDENGRVRAEHADLDGDGKVDRYTSQSEAVAQYIDTNFDGVIDVVVERVDELEDFSLEGYDETFPKSRFLYRIREDRNRDGKLDHEKLTARGALPAER